MAYFVNNTIGLMSLTMKKLDKMIERSRIVNEVTTSMIEIMIKVSFILDFMSSTSLSVCDISTKSTKMICVLIKSIISSLYM